MKFGRPARFSRVFRPLLRRRAPPHVIGVGARAPAIPAVSRPRCVLSFCTLALVPRRCNLNPRVSSAIRQGVEQDVHAGRCNGRCPDPWRYGQTTITVNVRSLAALTAGGPASLSRFRRCRKLPNCTYQAMRKARALIGPRVMRLLRGPRLGFQPVLQGH